MLSWSNLGRIPAVSPLDMGLYVGFPSRRSRVRGPSSALGEAMQGGAITCKQGESCRRSPGAGAATLCEVLRVRRGSWSHLGRIGSPSSQRSGGLQ